jgi:hypothetical protein
MAITSARSTFSECCRGFQCGSASYRDNVAVALTRRVPRTRCPGVTVYFKFRVRGDGTVPYRA